MTTLVLFLHGVGSNGADLRQLSQHFAQSLPGAVFLSPDGTQPFDGGGNARQWFSVAGVTEANRPARIEAARPALDTLIDAAKAQAKADQVILIGFSQGSIMALDALARGKVSEVVAFAGRLAFTGTPTPQPQARALLVGGMADQVISHRLSSEAGERLAAVGVDAKVVILSGVPHTITGEGIAAAQAFLAQV
jgi:phospholipase/carboxylesterase